MIFKEEEIEEEVETELEEVYTIGYPEISIIATGAPIEGTITYGIPETNETGGEFTFDASEGNEVSMESALQLIFMSALVLFLMEVKSHKI